MKFIESGMVVGLGHGSTASFALQRMAALLNTGALKDIIGIPCSLQVEEEARKLCIPLCTLDEHPVIDTTIDGADEVYIPAQYGHFEIETSGGQWYITGGKIDNIWNTWNVKEKTEDYSAKFKDFVLANANGGAITITLPAVSTPFIGARIEVKKIDSSTNAVTIATADSATIDGASTITLSTQYEAYTMVSDGSNWFVE